MSEELVNKLRIQAEEIANNNLPGWGNTILDAANVLQRQAKELEKLQKGITYLIENCGDIPKHMIIEDGLEDFINE